MFGIGSMLGKIANGLPVGQVVSQLPPEAAKALQGMGPAIKGMGSIGKPPHPGSTGGVGATGGFGGGVPGGFGKPSGMGGMSGLDAGDTHKAAYMTVLTQAIEKAHGSRAFNMATQINDLNVKLSNLRNADQHLDGLHEAISKHDMMSKELKQVLSGIGDVIKPMVQKLK